MKSLTAHFIYFYTRHIYAKGLSVLNLAFSVIGLGYVFLEYRKSSEDTTVGTVHMDSVTEDKQLGGEIKNEQCVAKDSSTTAQIK